MNHPEMTRMLIAERQRDMLVRAEEQRTARLFRRARKARAAGPAAIAVPRVPDYVDGSFREDQPAHPVQAAVPAARRAA